MLLLSALVLSSCVADPPPRNVVAVAGDRRATVSWDPPLGDNSAALVGYRVWPSMGGVVQAPVQFNSTNTTQTITGLTNGSSYTFTVAGISALGDETARSAPSNVTTPLTTVAMVAAGGEHSCALLMSGRVKCWGSNVEGQLGSFFTYSKSTTPVYVTGLQGATSIGLGQTHTCASLIDGTVRCWGYNAEGELGDGSRTTSAIPVVVVDLTDVVGLAVGSQHSCAVLSDGTAKCWGHNPAGALGDGRTGVSPYPVAVNGVTGIVQLAGGGGHTCALLADRTVRCWGWNQNGQLGDGTTSDSLVPVVVIGLSDVVAIAAGERDTCALLASGGVKCWGEAPNGASLVPATVAGIDAATSITTSFGLACASLDDGAGACWGSSSYGQLGNGTSGGYSIAPVPVAGLLGAKAIAAGRLHGCALTTGGVWCWGANHSGQLGNGTTAHSSVPVRVSGL